MTLRLTNANTVWPLRLMAFGLLLFAYIPGATAQSIVVMVNDEPVTSYDVAQRERFLALTSGLGDRMRTRLKSEKTQKAFKAYMAENRPQTREEAQALQKKFVQKIQQQVISNASSAMRKQAIDQLIEERLMVQAAKDKKIEVSDDEINKAMTRMAQGGSQKRTLKEFMASFRAQGVNPSTLKERIRAQLAWRDLIRNLYLPLVRSTVSALSTASSPDDSSTTVDAEIVKLSVAKGGDQKAIAGRLVEADEIRKGFSSCSDLHGQLKGRKDVSVQSVKKAGLANFPGDVRAALTRAKPGDMTPPIIRGNVVETVAVCAKNVPPPKKTKQQSAEADERQEQLQLYSERHLKDLRDRALLKYPKSG